MTAIIGAGDTDRDGTTDLYARKADGTMVLYRKNGTALRWSRAGGPEEPRRPAGHRLTVVSDAPVRGHPCRHDNDF